MIQYKNIYVYIDYLLLIVSLKLMLNYVFILASIFYLFSSNFYLSKLKQNNCLLVYLRVTKKKSNK